MSTEKQPGIYLIIEFDWPEKFDSETGLIARKLHAVSQDKRWIKPIVAASGGIGKGASSMWIFWLENYAALDALYHDPDNEIGKLYISFFSKMNNVTEKIREEVFFLQS